MAPVAVLLSLLTNCVSYSNADWTYGYNSTERTSMLASRLQSHNDAQVLLVLQDYVDKLSHTQRTLEATYASLQQTELLAGVIHEQDCRAIRTAYCCLNSLRIRVEARANVTERAGIRRQLQLMQASVQPHLQRTSTQLIQVAVQNSAEHFDDGTGPCQENSTLAMPVPMRLS